MIIKRGFRFKQLAGITRKFNLWVYVIYLIIHNCLCGIKIQILTKIEFYSSHLLA